MRIVFGTIIAIIFGFFATCIALEPWLYDQQEFPYDKVLLQGEAAEEWATVDFSGFLHDEVVGAEEDASRLGTDVWIITRLIRTMGLDSFARQTDKTSGDTAWWSNYIIRIVNYAMAMAAFLALAMMIYGFYKMFFSKEEEWFADAKKIVINAAIGLGILGVSYFIVSFIFYIFNTVNNVAY